MLAVMLLCALTAKPVAKAYQGPLDVVDVGPQSAGAVALFADTDRSAAQKALTQVATALGLRSRLRVAFIHTEAGPLAAISFDRHEGRATPFGQYTAFAHQLSLSASVKTTWAFLAPGPQDDSLEQEAWFSFSEGRPVESARRQYRDEPTYLEWVRRGTSASRFHAARWPAFPLSGLAQTLKLPGRGVFDNPWQLQTLASQRWPIDAGENLAMAWVDLPGGVSNEMHQLAIKERRSISALVAEALEAARASRTLADAPLHSSAAYDEGQPEAEKHSRRSLHLFIPQDLLEAAEESGAAETVSISRVVQFAWRRAHPAPQ